MQDKASLLSTLDKHHMPSKKARNPGQGERPRLPSASSLVKSSALRPHRDVGWKATSYLNNVMVSVVRLGYLNDDNLACQPGGYEAVF